MGKGRNVWTVGRNLWTTVLWFFPFRSSRKTSSRTVADTRRLGNRAGDTTARPDPFATLEIDRGIGVLARVQIGLTPLDAQTRKGKTINITAMLDTGATVGVMCQRHIDLINPTKTATGKNFHSTSTNGNPVLRDEYQISVTIDIGGKSVTVPNVTVGAESELYPENLVILGRDFLDYFYMEYNGPRKTAKLYHRSS
jgi:hypothetical protein